MGVLLRDTWDGTMKGLNSSLRTLPAAYTGSTGRPQPPAVENLIREMATYNSQFTESKALPGPLVLLGGQDD